MTRKIRDLSGHELGLLAEAIIALGIASFAVAVIPFRRLMGFVHAPATVAAADERQMVRSVAWAIGASARRVPWRALCLEQGLAAQWMLRRRSIAAVIHYGVAKADDGLQAHAWVRTAQYEVVGCENAGEFAELARFPAAREMRS